MLAALHWLPVDFRVHYKVLIMVFKGLHGLAPEYISCLLQQHCVTRPLRSSQSLLLHVPRSRLKTKGDRAFSVAAPHLWNSLQLHIRSCDSLDCFKSMLKTHLYSVAYSCPLAVGTLFSDGYCCVLCLFLINFVYVKHFGQLVLFLNVLYK